MTHEKQSYGINWPEGLWSQTPITLMLCSIRVYQQMALLLYTAWTSLQCALHYRYISKHLKEWYQFKINSLLDFNRRGFDITIHAIYEAGSPKNVIELDHRKVTFLKLRFYSIIYHRSSGTETTKSRESYSSWAPRGRPRKLEMSTKQINYLHTGNITRRLMSC